MQNLRQLSVKNKDFLDHDRKIEQNLGLLLNDK